VDGYDFVGRRITQHPKPTAAAVAVDPAFGVQSLEIVTVKQVIGPFCVTGVLGTGRAVDVQFAAKAKLGLIAYTAEWTFNSKHYQSLE
jgi:hypothetical protein